MVFLTWIRIHIYFKVVCLVSFRHLLVSVFPSPSFSPSLSLSPETRNPMVLFWYSAIRAPRVSSNTEQGANLSLPDIIQQQSGWVFLALWFHNGALKDPNAACLHSSFSGKFQLVWNLVPFPLMVICAWSISAPTSPAPRRTPGFCFWPSHVLSVHKSENSSRICPVASLAI